MRLSRKSRNFGLFQFLQVHLAPSWFHVKVCLVASVGFFTDA